MKDKERLCVRENEKEKKYITRKEITDRERERERENYCVIFQECSVVCVLDAFFLRPEILR